MFSEVNGFSQNPIATVTDLCLDPRLPHLNFSSHHSCLDFDQESVPFCGAQEEEDILFKVQMAQYHIMRSCGTPWFLEGRSCYVVTLWRQLGGCGKACPHLREAQSPLF